MPFGVEVLGWDLRTSPRPAHGEAVLPASDLLRSFPVTLLEAES
jgi:hypothetical protein